MIYLYRVTDHWPVYSPFSGRLLTFDSGAEASAYITAQGLSGQAYFIDTLTERTPHMDTRFIVMTAGCKMPSSCWGRYGRVAVCEVKTGITPKMISERALGMVRIVSLQDTLYMAGSRSAYQIALREAQALADKLNTKAEKNAARRAARAARRAA